MFLSFIGNAERNYNRTMEWLGHVSVEGRSSEETKLVHAVHCDNFLRFLDDSWTIRDRFPDDLNNIIFFMISG
ncbi:unnamed protein product [Rhizophagus irregularis]|nr:unnamed protein product [Rhizophagus irregularis]